MKHLFIALLAASFFAAVSNAQTTSKVTLNASKTAANSGKMMFDSYCTTCHGADGRGDGSAASLLPTHPTDLTLLSKNNHGQFPDRQVTAVLRFGVNVPAHGTAKMPTWGPMFARMAPNRAGQSDEEALRISNLVHYLETIQTK